MNSFLKQTSDETNSKPKNVILEFENSLLEIELSQAEMIWVKLKFLGLNYDPFNPEGSAECLQIIESLGLGDHLNNPYIATNILLCLLDKIEDKINNLKQ
jgi:hypothetical protein